MKVRDYTAKTGNVFKAVDVDAPIKALLDSAFKAAGGRGERAEKAGLLIRSTDGYAVLFKPEDVGAGNVAKPASEADAIVRQWAEYKAAGGPAPVPEAIAKQVARLLKAPPPPAMAPAASPPPAMEAPAKAPRRRRA